MTLYAQESQNVNVECSHHQKVSTQTWFNFKIPAVEPSSYDTWYALKKDCFVFLHLHQNMRTGRKHMYLLLRCSMSGVRFFSTRSIQ